MILAHVKCKRVHMIQYKAKDVLRLQRLSAVCFVFVFLLFNDVRHECASIFLIGQLDTISYRTSYN